MIGDEPGILNKDPGCFRGSCTEGEGRANRRFYLLNDKMYREEAHAYAMAKSGQGAPGVDGRPFWGIETLGLEEWGRLIRNDLRAKTYQPTRVRNWVMIPKPGGGERPLGVFHYPGPAVCTTRSRIVGIPSGLSPPPGFGIITRRTACG